MIITGENKNDALDELNEEMREYINGDYSTYHYYNMRGQITMLFRLGLISGSEHRELLKKLDNAKQERKEI